MKVGPFINRPQQQYKPGVSQDSNRCCHGIFCPTAPETPPSPKRMKKESKRKYNVTPFPGVMVSFMCQLDWATECPDI